MGIIKCIEIYNTMKKINIHKNHFITIHLVCKACTLKQARLHFLYYLKRYPNEVNVIYSLGIVEKKLGNAEAAYFILIK